MRIFIYQSKAPNSTPQAHAVETYCHLMSQFLMAIDQKVFANCSSFNQVTVAHPLRVCKLEEEEEEDEEEADEEDGEDRMGR